MTKTDHIAYWAETAVKDWQVSEDLFQQKHYVQCLFFAHLTLEKLCKAHWVKDNETNHPPRIHNLVKIISQTQLAFSEKDLVFLEQFNDFQLEGRYPDYTQKVYKICTKEFTGKLLNTVIKIRQCLLNKLP